MVSHTINLDKGKSILSKKRAQDWGANDITEDGYLEETIPDSRGYESDTIDETDQVVLRAPLSNPFSQGGNWYRKTVKGREGQPYFKPLGGKPFSDTKHAVTLDNGQLLRNSDLAFKKTQTLAPTEFSSVPNPLNTKKI